MAQKKKKDKNRKLHQQRIKKLSPRKGLSPGQIAIIIVSLIMVFTMVIGSLAASF